MQIPLLSKIGFAVYIYFIQETKSKAIEVYILLLENRKSYIRYNVYLHDVVCPPELLAGDDPVEVPGDALGAHEGEDLGVLCVTQLQEPGQQRHRGLAEI